MFKMSSDKKLTYLSYLLILIGIIAMIAIALSSSIVRTILTLIGAVTVLLFIGKKMDKIKKS